LVIVEGANMELLTPFTKVEIEVMTGNLNRKQVGILGGNFNPIHQAHLIVADQVKQQLGLDEVLLMPEYLPPHVDEKQTIPGHHRAKMVELAIENHPGLALETIELSRAGKSYTYDTMKDLTNQNPDIDYYFIIGGDMVAYLPKWRNIDQLVEMVQFVGVQRPGYKSGTSYPVIWVDIPKMDISSKKIRQLIRCGNEPNFLVPPKVLDYIYRQGLYINE
jgi:nicotinate-nucleotide adenylyltransferase